MPFTRTRETELAPGHLGIGGKEFGIVIPVHRIPSPFFAIIPQFFRFTNRLFDCTPDFCYDDRRNQKEELQMEKFIPYEKLSKKEKRKIDATKRTTWGDLNPVTRKPQNSKAYNRNKSRNWKREIHETNSGYYFCKSS